MANSRTNNTGTKNQQNGRQAKLPTADCRGRPLQALATSFAFCILFTLLYFTPHQMSAPSPIPSIDEFDFDRTRPAEQQYR